VFLVHNSFDKSTQNEIPKLSDRIPI